VSFVGVTGCGQFFHKREFNRVAFDDFDAAEMDALAVAQFVELAGLCPQDAAKMMRSIAFHHGPVTRKLFNEEASPHRQILSQRSQQGGQDFTIYFRVADHPDTAQYKRVSRYLSGETSQNRTSGLEQLPLARHSEATKNLKKQPPTHAAQLQFSASGCTISIRR
jgi:hypothetical protein